MSSVALANHLPLPPAVSSGGELAYVRDFPTDALRTAGNGGTKATYVAFGLDTDGGNQGLEGFSSRGRLADTQVFQQVRLPGGMLDGAWCFHAVQQHARGLFIAESDMGRVLVLNGVNAGLGIQASQEMTAVFHTTGQFRVVPVDDQTVELRRDGHTYVLSVVGDGSLDANGTNVVASLNPGSEVRGWISGFPATSAVMDHQFELVGQMHSACS